jgi:drug/metabolite transporter (DMT)-like permease
MAEWPALTVRVVTGNVAIFVNFMAVKYFKLTVVAMIINCAPILTIFLAGPLLGEKVQKSEVFSLILATGGIAFMIFGGEPDAETRL